MSFDWLINASSRLPFSILLSLRSQLSDRFTVTGLTMLAVAASVSLAMSVEVASRALQDELRTTTEALAGSAELSISAGDIGVAEGVLEQVRAVPGVIEASPLIRRTFRVASGPARGRPLHVLGLDLLGENEVRRYEVTRGQIVVRDGLRLLALPNSVVVSEKLAADLGIGEGDPLPLAFNGRPIELIVRGVLGGELAEAYGGQIAAMDIYALQALVGLEGRFERIDVAVESDELIEAISSRVAAAVGPALSVDRDAERESFGLALLKTYQRALWSFVLIALATSALLTYAASSMSIDRRLEELALLRIAGMEGVRVGRTVLVDSLVIAVVGTIAGALAAPYVSRAVFGVLSVASRVLYQASLREAEVNLETVAMGLLVGVATVVVAAVPPARRAAQIGALELLELRRGETRLDRSRKWTGIVAGAGTVLLGGAYLIDTAPSGLRVIAAVLGGIGLAAGLGIVMIDRGGVSQGWVSRLVPRVGFLVGPSLRDRPVETALTLGAWAIIVAGLVTGATTIRSYTGSIDGYFYGLFGESAVILFAGDPFGSRDREPITEATIRAVHATARVEELALVRAVEVAFRGTQIVVSSISTGAISRHGDLDFISNTPDATRIALEKGELAVNASFGERLGIRVGDQVSLPTLDGDRSLRVGAVVRGMGGPNGSFYLDEGAFEELFASGDVSPWMAVLWLRSPEAESFDVLNSVETDQPLFLLRGKDARRFVARSAEKYRAMLSVPIVLVSGLGVVSLLTLLLGATHSRRREFALLRASGATRANVVAVITLGGAAVGLLGAILGLVIGNIWSAVTCSFLSETVGWEIRPVLGIDLGIGILAASAAIAIVGSLAPALLGTRGRDHQGVQTP